MYMDMDMYICIVDIYVYNSMTPRMQIILSACVLMTGAKTMRRIQYR